MESLYFNNLLADLSLSAVFGWLTVIFMGLWFVFASSFQPQSSGYKKCGRIVILSRILNGSLNRCRTG